MTDNAKPPRGIVAVMVSADGRPIAHAASFEQSAVHENADSRRYQERIAKRLLNLAVVRALASLPLANAIDAHTAEMISDRMCATGCKVIMVAIGYDD